jgi:hypothetical protein
MNITRLSRASRKLIVRTESRVSLSLMPQMTPSQSKMYVSNESSASSVSGFAIVHALEPKQV